MTKKTMSKAAARRIQSATAKKNNGVVPKDSFAARAQATADTPPLVGPPRPSPAPTTNKSTKGNSLL